MFVICNPEKTQAFAGIMKTGAGLKQFWNNFPPVENDSYIIFASKDVAEKTIKDCGFHGIAVKL